MAIFVFDCETEPIPPAPSAPLPAFVAMGYCRIGGEIEVTTDIVEARTLVSQSAVIARDTLCGHNLAFDLGVLGLVPESGWLIHDTMITDMLQRLAEDDAGSETPRMRSLEALLGEDLAGKGSTQLSFQAGVPLTDDQLRYLVADIDATRRVYLRQVLHRQGCPGGVSEQFLQVRAAMALDRLRRTGVCVDVAEVIRQEHQVRAEKAEAAQALRKHGLLIPDTTGPRGGHRRAHLDMGAVRAAVERSFAARDLVSPTTDKGATSTDRDVLLQCQDDPGLKVLVDYKKAEKLISSFLSKWRADRVHPRYSLMMRTGRTSCTSPNLQQVPSRGTGGGVKKVFIPPPGRDLYEIDYCQLELCCLAELTQGALRRLINAGVDIHTRLAALFFHKEPQDVSKEERQLAKCAAFGFPGGMGARSFRAFVRSQGMPDPGDEEAQSLRNAWLALFPEMDGWLRESSSWSERVQWMILAADPRIEEIGVTGEEVEAAWALAQKSLVKLRELKGAVPSWLTASVMRRRPSQKLALFLRNRTVTVSGGRRRSPVSYTEERNTRFQGLAANLVKDALASLVLDHQFMVHAFIHDAVLISLSGMESVHTAADIMLDAAARWLPSVRVGVEICGPGSNWAEAKLNTQKVFREVKRN